MEAAAQLEGRDLSNGLLYRRFRADDGRTWWLFILWGQVNLAAVVEAPEQCRAEAPPITT
jgi:hypothetical protein